MWLRADLDVLLARVAAPQQPAAACKQGDPRAMLAELIERRHPIYAEADLVVDSSEGPPEATVTRGDRGARRLPARATPPEPGARNDE